MSYDHPYLEKRTFKRTKNRTRSWVFRCKECNQKVDDAVADFYWFRNDISQLFCSQECAISHGKTYECLAIGKNSNGECVVKIHIRGGKLSDESS